MRVTVRFVDGEQLEGDAQDVTLEDGGFTLAVPGGNNRSVWVADAAIKYIVLHTAEPQADVPTDPREGAHLTKVVLHFLDGETMHTYRDDSYRQVTGGFWLRAWDDRRRQLVPVLVSARALKGVFMVDDWDSRSLDERRRDATRRRRRPSADQVPTAWVHEQARVDIDPEVRRLGRTYQRRLALERDLELSPDPATFEKEIRGRLDRFLEDDLVALTPARREQLVQFIVRESVGYGPLDPLLNDPTISEIMVNSPDEVFVERAGQILRSQVRFDDLGQLYNVIRRMAAAVGRRVDESSPMVDARLPDGSRLNAVIPPAAMRGPALTIRKFRPFGLGLDELIAEGTLSPAMATFLQAAVEGRLSILVSGGTGSGKTTTLNVLGSMVPARERVVTIEDSAELQLNHPNLVALEYRPANVEGKGELTIRQLLRNSLRMRPDRVMVGEVRDAAALDMLQAMNTGHDGSMSTIHANSAADAFSRLETMVLSGSVDLPLPAVRAQVASALNLVIHQARLPDGGRKIMQVAELRGYDGDQPILDDLFRFVLDQGGRGYFEATGVVPRSISKMAFHGVSVPAEIFTSERFAAPDRRVPEGAGAGVLPDAGVARPPEEPPTADELAQTMAGVRVVPGLEGGDPPGEPADAEAPQLVPELPAGPVQEARPGPGGLAARRQQASHETPDEERRRHLHARVAEAMGDIPPSAADEPGKNAS